MNENARDAVRESAQNLLRLSRERDRLFQEQKQLQHDLDITQQQNFLATVDVIKQEGLDILHDQEFFDFILSGLMTWKNYSVQQKAQAQTNPIARAQRAMGFSNDHLQDVVTEDADSILAHASIDMNSGLDIENALNDVLQHIGFRLTVMQSHNVEEDGTYHIGLMLVACIHDTQLFLREVPKYKFMFDSMATTAHHGEKRLLEEGVVGSFSFIALITEGFNEDSPGIESLPVVRATELASPFDAEELENNSDIVWTLHSTMHDMTKNRGVIDSHQNMFDSIQALHQLQ